LASREVFEMPGQRELYEIVKSFHKDETLPIQLLVIMYELGDLAKSVQRIHLEQEDYSKVRAYLAEAKKALADIITQLQITCEHLEFDFDELRKLGALALIEKSKKWLK